MTMQHFLLSAAASTLSFKVTFRIMGEEAYPHALRSAVPRETLLLLTLVAA